jgi:hypothetical protein
MSDIYIIEHQLMDPRLLALLAQMDSIALAKAHQIGQVLITDSICERLLVAVVEPCSPYENKPPREPLDPWFMRPAPRQSYPAPRQSFRAQMRSVNRNR